MSLVSLAKKVRHAPGLRRLEPLWRILRPGYHFLLDPFDHGVEIRLGGKSVRLPASVLGTNPNWETYERESLLALDAWLQVQSGRPTLLDIGCSFGIFTSFVLQVCSRAEVIAFDSDVASLRAMDAVVPPVHHSRFRRVHGLLGSSHTSNAKIEAAIANTATLLAAQPLRTAVAHSRFVCLGEPAGAGVPQHQLDALLAGVSFPGPVLVKCDVEGAEVLVLSGARQTLLRLRPPLLLSVHPFALGRHGHSVADLTALLRGLNYSHQTIATDHEEHWWCQPLPA